MSGVPGALPQAANEGALLALEVLGVMADTSEEAARQIQLALEVAPKRGGEPPGNVTSDM